jgi:hypothetical protein
LLLLPHVTCEYVHAAVTKLIGYRFDDAEFVREPAIVANHFGVVDCSTFELLFVLRHSVHERDPGQLGIETHGDIEGKLLLQRLTLDLEVVKRLNN